MQSFLKSADSWQKRLEELDQKKKVKQTYADIKTSLKEYEEAVHFWRQKYGSLRDMAAQTMENIEMMIVKVKNQPKQQESVDG